MKTAAAFCGMLAITSLWVGAGGAVAQPVRGHITYAREANELRLSASGLEKCRAFQRVRKDTDELQASDHGTLTRADTRRLMHQLAQARRMPPHSLTPAKCGVAL